MAFRVKYTICKRITSQTGKEYVTINGKCSAKEKVSYGVSQGSLLGPRLFAIHVNDPPNAVTKGSLEMYADDTEYFCIAKSVDEALWTMQQELAEISHWCKTTVSLSIREKQK